MDKNTLLTLILFVPLVSAVFISFFLRRHGQLASYIAVSAAFLIMALSLKFLWDWKGALFHSSMQWFQVGSLQINIGFLIDDFAVTMLLVVSVVAFFIHVFSIGYMNEDLCKGRYFAGLSVFMFSMLGIVLADNLIMLFIFWELVGFSSYALIAHYKDTQEALSASKKAFIVNRVGDFGFLVGIAWCYSKYGTVDLLALKNLFINGKDTVPIGLGFLLICGFLGKSAQLPLHVWLPDAMAGPTPVSALIHAATMVAAGIYFLIRIFFMLPAEVLFFILWIGALMTAFAGFWAISEKDIKKILAYSTLSQLGYMGTAIGLGYPGLALFHLATHACFKALLFLGAGSVIHSTGHEQNIFNMGGLFKRMPVTSITFLIGLMALCGITFTSGYFSKDAIIEAAYFKDVKVFSLILFSAFLTAFYMGRLFFTAFLGSANTENVKKAHESSFEMTFPLIVLAALSLLAGYTYLWPRNWSSSFLSELGSLHELMAQSEKGFLLLIVTLLTWLIGFVLSYLLYGKNKKPKKDAFEQKFPFLYSLSHSKFGFDLMYNFYVKKIQQCFADLLYFVDLVFISGFLVRGCAGLFGLLGILSRIAHVGSLHAYLYWFLLGTIFYVVFALF